MEAGMTNVSKQDYSTVGEGLSLLCNPILLNSPHGNAKAPTWHLLNPTGEFQPWKASFGTREQLFLAPGVSPRLTQ